MDSSELLRVAAENLDSLGIEFFVTGSMATITYGEPRFTNDVDIVASIPLRRVAALCAKFSAPDFYCSQNAVVEAIESQRMFNIIHPLSGLKLDIMIPEDEPFNESRFARRRWLKLDKQSTVPFASPEDVILKKLVYYREGGSEKHLRDIKGVLKLQQEQIDFDYLKTWAEELNVSEQWDQFLHSPE